MLIGFVLKVVCSVVEWVGKDPYSLLTTVALALALIFIASPVISRKMAAKIEEYQKQKEQENHQENMP